MDLLNNYSAFFSFLQSSPLSNRKLLIVKGLFQERTQKAQTRRERERERVGGRSGEALSFTVLRQVSFL